ncbi:fatty acid amide hydrolase [Tanacetum coccineum]
MNPYLAAEVEEHRKKFSREVFALTNGFDGAVNYLILEVYENVKTDVLSFSQTRKMLNLIQIGYDKQGLPIGLQLIGRPWGEAEILYLAGAIEPYVFDFDARVLNDYIQRNIVRGQSKQEGNGAIMVVGASKLIAVADKDGHFSGKSQMTVSSL